MPDAPRPPADPLDPAASPISVRATHAMGTFSEAERRVARALLADYPSAALSTASDLADRSGTSAATVVRFCARIGLDGYAHLQRELRRELSERQSGPSVRARAPHPATAASEQLARRAEVIAQMSSTLPDGELERLIDLLASDRRTVLVCGGKLSHLAARYLQLQLRHVRPRVYYLHDPLRADTGYLLDARRGDVLVAFDFRRYETATADVARIARERGCLVALVTDTWRSPIAAIADLVLPVEVSSELFDTLTGATALVEVAVSEAAHRLGAAAVARIDAHERLTHSAPGSSQDRQALDDARGP